MANLVITITGKDGSKAAFSSVKEGALLLKQAQIETAQAATKLKEETIKLKQAQTENTQTSIKLKEATLSHQQAQESNSRVMMAHKVAMDNVKLSSSNLTTEIDKGAKSEKNFEDAASDMSDHSIVKFGLLEEAGRKVFDGLLSMGEKVADVGKDIVSAAGDYQQNQLKVQFLTGASTEAMQAYNKEAIDIGKTTSFSSKEAMDAMANLAQMHYSQIEIIGKEGEQNGVLAEAAKAAMVNNEGLTQATDTLTSTMHGFGITSDKAGATLDMMTEASQLGKISFDDFGKAAENVGLVSKSTGQIIEGTTSELLALTNTGMGAERSSQTLRFALTQIEKPSKAASETLAALGLSYYDSNGHMKQYADIVDMVNKRTVGMTDEQKQMITTTLFSKNGVLAYNAALNAQATETLPNGTIQIHRGTDALRFNQKQLEQSNGTMDKAVDIMKNGFNYQVKQMQGSIEEAMISVGTALLPGLTNIIKLVTENVNKFIDWEQKTHTVGNAIGSLGQIIGTTLQIIISTMGPIISNVTHIFITDILPIISKLATIFVRDVLPVLLQLGHFILTNVIPPFLSLGKTIIEVILPPFMQFVKFAAEHILPNLIKFGEIIFNQIIPPLIQFVNTIITQVVPVVMTFIGQIGDILGPVLISLGNTIINDIIPTFVKFVKWVGENVIPKVLDLFKAISEKVVPIFKEAGKIITENVIPTLVDLFKTVTDHVIPTLFSWWDVIATFLQPIFNSVCDFIVKTFLPALGDIWKWVDKNLIPVFNTLCDVIGTNVMPVLKTIAGFLGGTLGVVFGIIGNIIGTIIDIIGRLAGTIDAAVHGRWGDAWDAITGKTKVMGDKTDDLQAKNKDLFDQLDKANSGTLSTTATKHDDVNKKLDSSKTKTNDYKGASGDLFSFLDSTGSKSLSDHKVRIEDISKKLTDGKPTVNDYKDAHNDIIKLFNQDAPGAFNNVKQLMDDLTQKFKDGKISADTYNAGVSDIKKSLDEYNAKQLIVKKFTSNSTEFIGEIDKVAKKLYDLARQNITVYIAPGPVQDYPSTNGAGVNYGPGTTGGPVAMHASGTDFHPGGPALVGEKGPELLNVFGKLFAVKSPTFLANLPRGAQVGPAVNATASNSNTFSGSQKTDIHNHYYNVQANYKYQEHDSLAADIRRLQMLNSRT